MSKPAWFQPNQFVAATGMVCSCCGVQFITKRDRETQREILTHESDFPSFCPNEGKTFAAPIFTLEEVK